MAELMGALLIPPRSFWSLTIRELDAIVYGRMARRGATSPMTSSELAQLMRTYPDVTDRYQGA